ncbi:NADH-quinone oxidoreductase subunit C [Streptacidiphilus sp. EB129]|uniref:NADH-quinone oxidoreductase subunit C n=1 Tax=Streptacidiphilus sp. EB129 TaxID=3156262 RepID=UPI003517C8EF
MTPDQPHPAEPEQPATVDPVAGTAAAIGPWATGSSAFDLLTVDVPAEHWIEALTAARDALGLTFFDWLSAVDELADGFTVAVHLAAVGTADLRHLLLRTRIPRDAAALPTATGLYAGAGWHERETHEMFGIDFPGHPHLITLLLPDGFEGHPLRKEFVLAARVAKAWPGAKEPGESDHTVGEGAPTAARRRMLPPGVPDPNEWGPLAGTLPPVAERPARTPRAAGAAARGAAAGTTTAGTTTAGAAAGGAAADRPIRADRPRRTRSVGEGSTSQAPTAASTPEAPWHQPATPAAPESAPTTPPQPEQPQAAPEPQPTSEQPQAVPTPEQPQPASDADAPAPIEALAEPQPNSEPQAAPAPGQPQAAPPQAAPASEQPAPEQPRPAPEQPQASPTTGDDA